MLARLAAGLLVAAGTALAAWRAGSLSPSGAVAATAVGTASIAGGWALGALLVAYFVAASALSRLGADRKARRTAGIAEKGERRDATQVLANGGLFAALALASAAAPGEVVLAAAVGALAASSADTWGTEIGTLHGGEPRSVLTGRRVPTGTSGGVSGAGTLATIAGAAFVALAARGLGLGIPAFAVVAGGTFGALADSLIGARLQERRWCASCERQTERRVHDCGRPTTRLGGVAWMSNDAVNLAATLAGATATAALVTL